MTGPKFVVAQIGAVAGEGLPHQVMVRDDETGVYSLAQDIGENWPTSRAEAQMKATALNTVWTVKALAAIQKKADS